MTEEIVDKTAKMTVKEGLYLLFPRIRLTRPGPLVYVDEKQGNDESGDGSEAKPFAATIKALASVQGGACQIKMKTEDGWTDISGAGLKKAKKGYEGLVKKLEKQKEAEQKAAQNAAQASADEAKRLEEAKKIVLKPDPSLPAAKKVRKVEL